MTISVTKINETLTLVKAALTTATGTASETTTESLSGAIKRVVTVPQSGVAPSANWDLTIADKLSVDLLGGQGADRDSGGTGATEDFIISDARAFTGRLTFAIANGGNSKKVTVFAYIEKAVNPSPSITDVDAILTNTSAIRGYTDTVEGNQSTIITNTSAVMAYTDTLETVQATLMANASAVMGYTDTVETNQSALMTNTSTIMIDLDAVLANSSTTVGVISGDVDSVLTNTSTLVGAVQTDVDAALANTSTVMIDANAILTNSSTVIGVMQTDLDAALSNTSSVMIDGDTILVNQSTVITNTSSLMSRLTASRADYLDNLNPVNGSGILNDANQSALIAPTRTPVDLHVVFDVNGLNNNNDDFDLSISVGVAGSELVTSWYNLTSDGTDITVDKGSGVGAIIKQRRMDISDIMVDVGEQAVLNYTKNSATDRNVPFAYFYR